MAARLATEGSMWHLLKSRSSLIGQKTSGFLFSGCTPLFVCQLVADFGASADVSVHSGGMHETRPEAQRVKLPGGRVARRQGSASNGFADMIFETDERMLMLYRFLGILVFYIPFSKTKLRLNGRQRRKISLSK